MDRLESCDRPTGCRKTSLVIGPLDLPTRMNNHEVSILLLLDLTTAFDTVDHDILINKLMQVLRNSITVVLILSSGTYSKGYNL